jgi:transcriptional regulator with XRE-family HTH domain
MRKPPATRPQFGPSPLDLADRIRRERERLGLTKSEVARKLEVRPHSYRQLEEAASPQLSTVYALIEVVGMRPRALLPELFESEPKA